MTIDKCAACSRKAVLKSKYCTYHDQAFKYLTEHYAVWVKAYGSISMEDFMVKLTAMDDTGIWIKEVIAVELKP
jgi:hypothetical protein